MPSLQPGQTIGGYKILAFHGKGGMGEIFRALQLSIGREVALKILSPQLARRDPQFAKSFVDEARAAGRLNHPNIIGVHDVGKIKPGDKDEPLYYFSMEFVDGENLREVLDREGVCPQELIEKTMLGMAEALVYAEQMGMVHRDIKPENIMVTKDGRIKLADFGLAQEIDLEASAERDQAGRIRVMGTPRYMSPEQARGRPVDGRSDQYSLGASLFHLLTGSPPYRRESGRATMKAHVSDPIPDPGELVRVSPAWRSLCMRLMAKTPEQRFANAGELLRAVRDAIAGKSLRNPTSRSAATSAVEAVGAYRGGPWSPLVLSVGGGLMLMALLLVFWAFPSSSPPSSLLDDSTPASQNDDDSHQDRNLQEEIIEQLPEDLETASVQIQAALDKPYFRPGSEARALLTQQQVQIHSRIQRAQAARRHAILEQLRLARRHANQSQIAAAQEVLDSISPEDRALLADEIEQGLVHLRSQAEAIHAVLLNRLERSNRSEDFTTILEQAQSYGLHQDLRDNLAQVAQQRQEDLQQAEQMAAAAAAERQQQLFLNLAQGLNATRSPTTAEAPDIREFITFAQRQQRMLQDPPLQEICALMVSIGQAAQRMSTQLRDYVARENPEVRIESFGRIEVARIQSLEEASVWLEIPAPGGRSMRTRKSLDDPEIDHLNLVRQAYDATGAGDDDLAAYLWMWRHPAATQHPFASPQLQQAAERIEAQAEPMQTDTAATEEPEVDPETTDLSPLTEMLVLAEHPTEAPGWFQGGPVQITAEGLQWVCEESVRLQELREEILPTLTLRQAMLAPLRLSTHLRVGSGSLVLVGLRQGLRNMRLGLDTRNNRIGGVVSDPQGNIRSSPLPRNDHRVNALLHIEIIMDQAGAISFLINGQAYDAPAGHFSLDPTQETQLVFQALNTGNSSSLTIERLHIVQGIGSP